MSKKRNRNKKKTKGAPVVTAQAVCAAADGRTLTAGFSAFGPINGPLASLTAGAIQTEVQVAAEQLAHFAEAWKYAASSLHAYMSNSRENAVHFAYYSELRTAMSLFAYSGISVHQFNGCFYLDASGKRVSFSVVSGDATHKTVWAMWKDWGKRSDAAKLLAGIRFTRGVSLGDFSNVLSGYAPPAVLNDWGYDLLTGTLNDHNARNLASYNPLLVNAPLEAMEDASIELITNVWRALLSGSVGVRFDEDFVRFLVHRSIKGMIVEQPGDPDYQVAYDVQRAKVVAEVAKARGVSDVELAQALALPVSDDLFRYAAEASSGAENVLCRALFLLRVASLAIEDNLTKSGSAPARSWLKNWLSNAGIFPSDGSVEIEDVRQDYEEALAAFQPVRPFPRGIWTKRAALPAILLSRPDAFVSWALTY